jgi:exodeoxyribonuclease VII large subunit
MSDFPIPEASSARPNLPEFTVAELSAAVKRSIEGNFGFVRVRGEISRPTTPGSGHCYLRLKDEAAVLDAVIWKGTLARLGLRPEDGMEVICTGRLTTYPGKSTYQLIIERMELAGEGALLKMIEERRKRLAAEGLFDEARKKKLPFLPDVIGVITSPTGAVIRDILHRLADRFPRHVLLWPVAVQGEGAADQVASAIAGFNALPVGGKVPRPDVLIVARGGGSLEDLMAFNEENVVRAAAASRIPLISAVGHETDTTLIDFASDRRAPTPTAAAEMAVPVRADLVTGLARDEHRLIAALTRRIEECRTRVESFGRALGDPGRLIDERAQRLDDRGERLRLSFVNRLNACEARVTNAFARLPHPQQQVLHARQVFGDRAIRLGAWRDAAARLVMQHGARVSDLAQRAARCATRAIDDRGRHLAGASQLLESFSYERVLDRGFALVHDADGLPVTNAADTASGQALAVRFRDGEVGVRVEGTPSDKPKSRKGPARKPVDQGSLL